MELTRFIHEALLEDIGHGDYSSLACIPAETRGSARLIIKDKGILAGMRVAKLIAQEANLEMEERLNDGDSVIKTDIAFILRGSVRDILRTERLILNCMQRMSGIATITHEYVKIASEYHVGILDTRKTTPLMRSLEKESVRLGGGLNHRMGLYDMIMLKDNHIDAAGGIANALNSTRRFLKEQNLSLKIEIETRNTDEVKEVLAAGNADRIMLDNFLPDQLREAVNIIGDSAETEASGGITLLNIREYAETGVNFISVGALTHSVKSLDLSLKIS